MIDYDGALYPSDEARMVSRVGLLNIELGTWKLVWTKIECGPSMLAQVMSATPLV